MKKLGFGTMRLPTLGDDSKVDPERFKEMYNEHCQMNKYTNGMVYYANFPRRNRQGVRLRWLWKVRGSVPPKAAHPGAAERSQGRV